MKLKKVSILLLSSMLLCSNSIFANSYTSTLHTQEAQINNENILITSGYLKLNQDNTITVTDKYVDYVQNKLKENGINGKVIANGNTIELIEYPSFRSAKAASGGVTKIKWESFDRFKLYLDNKLCNKFVAGSGTAAALSAWIPEPIVSKVVATALGASSGLIAYNNEGNGVIVSGIFSPVLATLYWIKPQ